MSGEDRRSGAPQGPPWSLELLADLHAGVLDDETATALRPQIEDDPEAIEILAALDATSDDLADLPELTMPEDVSARLDAALAEEIQAWQAETQPSAEPAAQTSPADAPESNVIDLAAARQRRRKRITAIGAGLLTAAAAVVGVVTFTSVPHSTTADNPQTIDLPATRDSAQPLTLTGDKITLTPAQLREAMHAKQYGPLSDPQKLIGCLQANGVDSGKPLGAREILLNGKPAQLLILSTGKIGQFQLIAVGPGCGPGRPDTISTSTYGG